MTIKDIAKNLNVSYSTVSLSLNNDPRVAEKTKKRVLAEAERLGFSFNENARSLVTKKTNRIGLVFSNNFIEPDYRWFFNEIETYSTRAVEKGGYDFIIQPNRNIESKSNIFRMVNGKMVDGLAIFSRSLTEEEFDFLEKSDFPHVYVYFKPAYAQGELKNFFWDDNRMGGYAATKYLIEHGHRKILTIRSSDPVQQMYDDRTQGYLDAMAESGLEPEIFSTKMDFDSQKALVAEKQDYLRRFTAIFSQQDLPALSIAQQMQTQYGVRIPEDLSLIGYNDIELIHYLGIPLDTVADSREQLIANAMNALICRIEGREEALPRKLSPQLIHRGSVKSL